MSPIVKLAILGAGTWAKEAHLPALANLAAKVELIAVYSRSESSAVSLSKVADELLEQASPVKVYFEGSPDNSLDALFESDVSAVIIALPMMKQPDLIRRAWAAGKSVASEKPVAGDVETATELFALFTEKYEPLGLTWHILENFVHEPAYLEARDLVASGAIGKLSFFSYSVCFFVDKANRFYQTEWRKTPSHAGGFSLDGGVHHSAALHLALPSPPAEVSAFASLVQPFLAPVDTLHSVIKLADGTVGTFELSFSSSPTFVREQLVLVGSSGHIQVDATSDGARQAGFTVALTKASVPEKQSMFFESNGVQKGVECFVDALQGTASPDALERARAPRATRDVTFILAAIGSGGAPQLL